LAAISLVIIYGFRVVLGVFFSAFSWIPGVNPLIFAELAATNFVGVLFWIGFKEAREADRFSVPTRAIKGAIGETRDLFSFQYNILRRNLTPSNLKLIGKRLVAWLKGEIPVDKRFLRGEVFSTAAMAYLLAGEFDKLNGPLGLEFMQAIRDRYTELGDASPEAIAEYMSQYDAEQLAGVINMVKGKLFERLVAHYENNDDDSWEAQLHENESYPGSDIVFHNSETGETIEISLKAAQDPGYIEHSLSRYPDIPIMTTEEVSRYFDGNDMVVGHELSNAEVTQITEDNFDILLGKV